MRSVKTTLKQIGWIVFAKYAWNMVFWKHDYKSRFSTKLVQETKSHTEFKKNVTVITYGTSQLENCYCNHQHWKKRFDEHGGIHFGKTNIEIENCWNFSESERNDLKEMSFSFYSS